MITVVMKIHISTMILMITIRHKHVPARNMQRMGGACVSTPALQRPIREANIRYSCSYMNA